MENQKQKTVETKHDKFVRLADKRTQSVLNSLRLLEGLSNTSNYEYSSGEVGYIFRTISAAVEHAHIAFTKQAVKAKAFSLLNLVPAGDAGDATEPAQE